MVGIFHADPHPGNVYLIDAGRIALLDCGAVGMLDRRQRDALRAVLVAAQDPAQLRSALRRITTPSRSIDGTLLERTLGGLMMDHLRPGSRPGAAFVTSLMDLMREFGLALEPVIGGALRALATLQVTLEALVPDFDLVDEATAYGRRNLANPLRAPIGNGSPREQLEALLPGVLPTLVELPRRLNRIIESVERDEFSVGVQLFRSDRDRRFVGQLAAQLVVTIVPAALGLIGALLVLSAVSRLDIASGRVIQAIGLGCVGIAVLTLLSTLVGALRASRGR
ncbi:hypothetical protein BH20ACT4_BH20ACT4_03750 [soil metagenome]